MTAAIRFQSQCEEDTERFAVALAKVVPSGIVIGLTGTLGAGKTRIVQAFAAACGVDRATVVSPTFVLCNEYYGDRSIIHIDAYRLSLSATDRPRDSGDPGLSEFMKLGVDDYFSSGATCLIEWADRVAHELPSNRIDVDIELGDHDQREIVVKCVGDRYVRVMDQLQALLAKSRDSGG